MLPYLPSNLTKFMGFIFDSFLPLLFQNRFYMFFQYYLRSISQIEVLLTESYFSLDFDIR